MASVEKINFNIPPKLKKDLERLASSYGKTLSAFMISVCDQLVKANADRIKQQALREQEPINFGGELDNKTAKKNKKSSKGGGDGEKV